MNTTSIDRQAEQKAAQYLTEKYRYKLLAQNWRTRTCEIDLIMSEP
jgi:Holliday junction resolvase-like predicted endonuclease